MIKATNLNIQFKDENGKLGDALFRKNVSLTLNPKEIVLLYGSSGCGKTTLFQMLSHLIDSTSGNISWNEYKIHNLNDSNKQRFKYISMIYSVFNFIETLSTEDNILLPALFAKEKDYMNRLKDLTELFDFGNDSNINLKDLLQKDISSLSNGQKEIITISRALLMEESSFVFADEMLRSFNEELEKKVWEKVLQYLSKHNKSLFMITHKKHIGETLKQNVQNNCSSDYKARIFTIRNQELIEETNKGQNND